MFTTITHTTYTQDYLPNLFSQSNAGVLAVILVLIVQLWLDRRQRKDHKFNIKLKSFEKTRDKKEQQIIDISALIDKIADIKATYLACVRSNNPSQDETDPLIKKTTVDDLRKSFLEVRLAYIKVECVTRLYFAAKEQTNEFEVDIKSHSISFGRKYTDIISELKVNSANENNSFSETCEKYSNFLVNDTTPPSDYY